MSQGKFKVFVIALVLGIIIGSVLLDHNDTLPPLPTKPVNGHFSNASEFVVGMNYPWFNYGNDFGINSWGHLGVSSPVTAAAVDADFAEMAKQGIAVVRWFLFTDGRAGLIFDGHGRVIGLDHRVFDDIDAAVAIAKKHNIQLLFVLLDFKFFEKKLFASGVQLGGHADAISDTNRQSFLDNALKPLFMRYANESTIVAWEVVNEPEWAINLSGFGADRQKVKLQLMQKFVGEVVEYIHQYSRQLATLGSAKRSWLRFWTASKLDFYQFHYYPFMELRNPINYPADKLALDKPCILGEFGTKNAKYSVDQYLEIASRNGYAAAFPWSFRATDKYSNYNAVPPGLQKWRRTKGGKPRP